MRMFNPPHPGELIPNFMHGRSVSEVARHMGVTRATLSRVIHGRASISPAMAVLLAESLGLEPEIWLRMQMEFDLWRVYQKRGPGRERLTPLERAA